MLDALPDARVRTLVVWEPVIFTDLAPPTSSVLALVRDRRARQYWDPGRAVSEDIVRSVNADPRRYGFDAPLGDGYIVWDVAAVFGPGEVWDADLPVPVFHDGPVAYRIDRLAAAIAQAASGASGGGS
jgi:hypothetical protein